MAKTKIKEFTLLNESVQHLLDTNISIYNSQKQFIENASHELQTPLAIGMNKLELLAGDPGLSHNQVQKIAEITKVLQRLSSLNKSLLLLSRIENKQFISSEEINFEKIISRILQDFTDYARHKKIETVFMKEGNWKYHMNKDLADMLVLNLVKNALIHNRKEGRVMITLSSSSLAVENTSHDPEILPEILFERFSGRSDKKGSTGLGLAIVKAIADVSDLAVTYTYNGSHVFEVKKKSA
jgi:signal transduction histidine kinase